MTVDLEESCKRILEERVCMTDVEGRDCGCGSGKRLEEDSGRESRGVEKFVEVTVTEDWKITVESSEWKRVSGRGVKRAGRR